MCFPQHPRPPGKESSNRQGPCIVTQLAHAERFSQKTPTYVILLSISHGNSCFAFVNGSSQTIACGLLRYSRRIASVQNLLQSDSPGSEIKGRMGWGSGGREGGGGLLFLFHHIPTHHSLKQYGLVLIHFRLSKSSPAKHLSNAASVFQSWKCSITTGLCTRAV